MHDDDYAELQLVLAARPDAGKVIKGSGGWGSCVGRAAGVESVEGCG